MGVLPWLVAGLLLPVALPVLPPRELLACLACAGLVLLCFHRCRGAAWLCLALAFSLHAYATRSGARFDPGPGPMEIWLEGRVDGLAERWGDALSFHFRTQDLPGRGEAVLLLRWHREAPSLSGGETWRLRLRLSPPRGRVNFAGPDSERHYYAEGIAALGVVLEGQRLHSATGLAGWRERVRQRLDLLLAQREGSGLVLALAVASRASLEPGLGEAMRRTGTAHLLAISGLHVGLVAMFTFTLLRWPLAVLGAGLRWRRPGLVAMFVALLAAVAYAALAGFATSTQRAVLMLSAPLLCAMAMRHVGPWTVWLGAAALVLVWQPLAGLEAGFWLSFGAVAVLIGLFAPRRPRPMGMRGLLLAQGGISVVMLPLGLGLFGMAAPTGFLVNLAAIPWVSLVTLPLTLAGLLLAAPGPVLAEGLLDMAARSAAWLSQAVAWCAAVGSVLDIDTAVPGPARLVLAMLGAVMLILPRGMALRWLGLTGLLPLLLPPLGRPSEGALRMEVLDVGQGLSAIVRTRNHAVLYDTGPGQPGTWDLVDSTLIPALLGQGIRAPERVLLSHGDLDHAGGLDGLLQRHPGSAVFASLRDRPAGILPCDDRLGWLWDEVSFQVLHPGEFLPYRGNLSSCVLSIATPSTSLLLPGDIDRAVERRLARLASRGHAVVVAPHHGSRSSSSAEWLAWTRPRVALFPAGAGNRFGFPHAEVRQRHAQAGVASWSTADCGALRIEVRADGLLEIASARRARRGPWRWPADPGCP